MSKTILAKSISIAVTRKRSGEKKEYAAFTINGSTQREAADFVKATLNNLGLPIVREAGEPHTLIQIRTRQGRSCIGKGIYLSFFGLSPEKAREVLLKHLV